MFTTISFLTVYVWRVFRTCSSTGSAEQILQPPLDYSSFFYRICEADPATAFGLGIWTNLVLINPSPQNYSFYLASLHGTIGCTGLEKESGRNVTKSPQKVSCGLQNLGVMYPTL